MGIVDLEFRIPHRNWVECAERLFSLLNSVHPGEVVAVVGPSRAGKTKMIDYMRNLLTDDSSGDSVGIMPVVVTEAANSGVNGVFSTKNFMIRLLEELRHPMFSLGSREGDEQEALIYHRIDKTTEASLRLIAERTMRKRKTKFLFIDEAQHVTYVSKSAQGPFAVMDSWKCFAKTANVILVIVGAYPILGILQNSPHMVGRKHQVHLARYRKNAADIEAFASVVAAYESHIGISFLSKNLQFIYEGTFGCIGLLRAWLLRSWAYANMRDQQITMEILIENRLPESDLAVIRAEIIQGETVLGLDMVDSRPIIRPEKSTRGKLSGKGTPFQRRPKRMKAGNRSQDDN